VAPPLFPDRPLKLPLQRVQAVHAAPSEGTSTSLDHLRLLRHNNASYHDWHAQVVHVRLSKGLPTYRVPLHLSLLKHKNVIKHSAGQLSWAEHEALLQVT